MDHSSAIATAIAEALPRGCTIGCASGPSAMNVLLEIVAQNKCDSLVTNNPLAAMLTTQIRTVLVYGPLDHPTLSVSSPADSEAVVSFQIDFALMTVSGISNDGDVFASTPETASGNARFLRDAAKGAFLIARSPSLLACRGTKFANVAELAAKRIRVVLATDSAQPASDLPQGPALTEKLVHLRALSARFPTFEVWSL